MISSLFAAWRDSAESVSVRCTCAASSTALRFCAAGKKKTHFFNDGVVDGHEVFGERECCFCIVKDHKEGFPNVR